MVRKIELPKNTKTCERCGILLQYEAPDAYCFDDGRSLFYTITCPYCGMILHVVPDEFRNKIDERLKVIRDR